MKKGLLAIVALVMLVLGATIMPAQARWHDYYGGWGGWGGWGPGIGLGLGALGLGVGMGLGSEYYGNPYVGYGGFYGGYPYGYGGVGLYSAPALYGSTCGACFY